MFRAARASTAEISSACLQDPGSMDAVIGLGTAGTCIVKQLLALDRSVRAVDFNDPGKMGDKFGPAGAQLQLMQVYAVHGSLLPSSDSRSTFTHHVAGKFQAELPC